MFDRSRLRPFMADDKEDGPETALVIKGFTGRDEIQAFMDMLMDKQIFLPPANERQ